MDQIVAKPGPAFSQEHANGKSIADLRSQAEGCQRCDLYKNATQLVFGEGIARSRVVLVGEQPGDREDLAGRPFVGPAGRVLDECLQEAGVDRALCYVTNAVKHFKFEPRGKRRLHSKPNAGEIQRCAWWLGAELDILRPKLTVALGATALYSLLGRGVGVTKDRGRILATPAGMPVLVTIHPSFLLRIRDKADVKAQRERFVEDLRGISDYLAEKR
ncbi:MAG: UdgX family uracil-DNA binding protein [Shinella sp.]|nr:UdgX family uracil-DNA binding protein [Shinella sp.]